MTRGNGCGFMWNINNHGNLVVIPIRIGQCGQSNVNLSDTLADSVLLFYTSHSVGFAFGLSEYFRSVSHSECPVFDSPAIT